MKYMKQQTVFKIFSLWSNSLELSGTRATPEVSLIKAKMQTKGNKDSIQKVCFFKKIYTAKGTPIKYTQYDIYIFKVWI